MRIRVERKLVDHLASMERFEEAETALLATWEESANAFGISHRRTLMAMSSLLQLYDVWGLPLRAAPCLKRHLSGRTATDLDTGRLTNLTWFVVRSAGFERALYGLALAAAERALVLAPEDEQKRSLVGMALTRLGRLRAADRELELCADLIERGSTRHGAFRVLVRIGLSRYEEAEELLDKLEAQAQGLHNEDGRVLIEARRRLERED